MASLRTQIEASHDASYIAYETEPLLCKIRVRNEQLTIVDFTLRSKVELEDAWAYGCSIGCIIEVVHSI